MAPLAARAMRSLPALLVLAAMLPAGAASVVWEASLDAPGEVSYVRTAAADGSGNLVVTGHYNAGGQLHCRTAKFDGATGTVAWQRSLAVAGGRCEAVALALDGAGNAIVASRSLLAQWTPVGSQVSKYAAADGALLWEKSFGNPADGADELFAVAADAAGNVIVTGRFVTGAGTQWRTIKYAAADGTILWERAFDGASGNDDTPSALALDAAGNVIVAGSSASASLTSDLVTIKYDGTSGAPLWTITFPAAAPGIRNSASDIAVDGVGNVLVLGVSVPDSSTLNPSLTTFKYAAADGALLWSATLADAQMNQLQTYGSIAVDPAGDVVVAGTRVVDELSTDIRTVKYAGATGAVRWSRSLHSGVDHANAVAFDGAGNPIVAGQGGPSNTPAFETLKFLAANGDIAWEFAYGGTVAASGSAMAVSSVPGAVLLAGDLYVPVSGIALPRWQALKVSDTPSGPPRVAHDFNADGRADFAFRHADGTTAIWLMDGAATASIGGIFDAGSGYSIVSVADFDGNGTADLLWQLPAGYAISLMNGSTFVATAGFLGSGTGWTPAFTADFDGDGKSDILMRHSDGRHAVFIMDGTAVVRTFGVLPALSGWNAVQVGHFDVNGRADILVRHDDGRFGIFYVDGSAVFVTGEVIGAAGLEFVVLADFDGNGWSDLVFKRGDGSHVLFQNNGYLLFAAAELLGAGSGWSIRLAADFDGDRRSDLVIAHSDGSFGIALMLGRRVASVGGVLGPGSGWTVVAARDTSGDGRADLLLRRSDGVYAIGLVNGTSMPTAAGVVGPPWLLVP